MVSSENLFYLHSSDSGDCKYRSWFYSLFSCFIAFLVLFKYEVVGCMHERMDVSAFWPISNAQLVLVCFFF